MTIQTSIIIRATPRKVWDHLLDFESYPAWNPFITSIVGKAEKGHRIKVYISGMSFKPMVLESKTAKELRWRGSLWFKGLFDGEHVFKIQQVSDIEVVFNHSERFEGILVPLFRKKLLIDTKMGFHAMNSALKNLCES
ncbi:SRPBCC domain-containing protein [Flavobacteriaceae bacterium TP-CH-4]|uniref:SRPBCC domain-containing protein n=1 Tax=Pelagihabitans pacificus TaxID=2696054 RepID=A0A967EF92_9FLAO|nr:SRPBCC domain-containing protein [Pelagihabitans pacificus]NHF61158.1 SRPBCC domain-containing protein [Pelagihabitans pacificus]